MIAVIIIIIVSTCSSTLKLKMFFTKSSCSQTTITMSNLLPVAFLSGTGNHAPRILADP